MPAIDASRQHAWTMKALTRLLFAIAIFALLACGDGTPVLELDDEGKPTEASLAMLRESAEDEAAFNEAFQSLILAEVLREMHDADNGLAGLAAVAAIGATGEDAMLDRAKHVYKRLEGLSSSEIITASQKRAAEMETKRELEQLEREQARQAYLGRLAAKVEFSATDFRVVAEEWVGERRYVDVTLTNNGDEAISGLTFKAEVRSPGRSVPWEDDDGMQVWFDGGIEGGESRTKRHSFNDLGAFSPHETYPDDAVFTATVECVYGPKDAEKIRRPLYDPPTGACSRIRSL